jgi:hypothetical protein
MLDASIVVACYVGDDPSMLDNVDSSDMDAFVAWLHEIASPIVIISSISSIVGVVEPLVIVTKVQERLHGLVGSDLPYVPFRREIEQQRKNSINVVA